MESIGKLLEKTLMHYEKKEYADAEKIVKELLSVSPDFHRGWFLKAVILEETGRTAEAEECFRKAGNVFNMFFRLAVQLQDADPQRALRYYDRALQMDDRYNPALLNKGLILEHMGKTDEARACYSSLSPWRDLISRIVVPLCFMSFLIGGGIVMVQRGERGLSLAVFVSAIVCFLWLKRDAGMAIKMVLKKKGNR